MCIRDSISGDSPLIDSTLVDRLVSVFRESDRPDLVTNVARRTFPKGQSIEVVSVEALRTRVLDGMSPTEKEHVTESFYKHPDGGRIISIEQMCIRDMVRAALASGKHVLCEKPFGSGLEDISGLDRIARRNGLTTALGYEFRYDNALRQMIDLVRAGQIGCVSRIDVTWLVATGLNPARTWSWRHDIDSAGGVLVDWCCHVIDYAHAVVGESIRELWCSTATRVRQRPDGLGGFKPATAPDSCDMHCIFENGAMGRFAVSNAEPAGIGHRIEVYGDRGCVRFHHAPPFTSCLLYTSRCV